MTGEIPPPDAPVPPFAPPPPRSSNRGVLIGLIVAFVLGVVVVVLALPLVERWRNPQAATATQTTTTATAPLPTAALGPLTLDAMAARETALDVQLRAIEARIALAETASRTAASDATRAERLLIAVAVRRELNRGLPLGYLETELRTHFADQPRAVALTIAAGRAPVTIEDLRQALDTLGPQLAIGTSNESMWTGVKRELSGLVVVRRESTPSPRPADRLARARRMVDAGNVEGALAEVTRMPGAGGAQSWTAAARRYVEARRGLNILEMAALDGTAPAAAQPPAASPAPAAPAIN